MSTRVLSRGRGILCQRVILESTSLSDFRLGRVEYRVSTIIPPSPEKGIAQHYVVDIVEGRVIDNIPVNEEEYRQINFLPRADLLFFETETFDFGKVWRDLMSASRPAMVNGSGLPSRESCCTSQYRSDPYLNYSSQCRMPRPFRREQPLHSAVQAQSSMGGYRST